MRVVVLAVLVFIFGSCNALEFVEGEKISSEISLPYGSWKSFGAEDGLSRTWYGDGDHEAFQVLIAKDLQYDLRKTLLIAEQVGRSSCDEYEAEIVSAKPVNNYPAVLYYSTCVKGDKKSLAIHNLIVASGASYAFAKYWSDSSLVMNYSAWLDYISNISVCSAQTSLHACGASSK
ncbi:hypothetical protein [Ectopseudomonas composti]|uniref:hypothetical protein n=1 Tax=Ectopseudomonas composti TaxID=658457 RepID=UPI0012E3A991|nr:hypothetical protein [Pseudomonas composti]